MVSRLADRNTVEQQHLIRPDDQMRVVRRCHCAGFGERQALRQVRWSLVGSGRLVDLWGGPVEGQAQALEQLATIGRAGGEYQRQHDAAPA